MGTHPMGERALVINNIQKYQGQLKKGNSILLNFYQNVKYKYGFFQLDFYWRFPTRP